MASNLSTGIANSTLEKCYNSGSVDGNISVGGIVGYIEGTAGDGITVKECYNKGTVTGTTSVGSIIGAQSATAAASNLNTFIDLYYQSTVGIGAITGEDDNTKYIGPLTAPDGNFNSKEEFLTWLDAQKASRANT